jgi:hypothetical protein
MTQDESLECIRRMGAEVLPKIRKRGAELGLGSPFDVNAPVSLAAALKRTAPASA